MRLRVHVVCVSQARTFRAFDTCRLTGCADRMSGMAYVYSDTHIDDGEIAVTVLTNGEECELLPIITLITRHKQRDPGERPQGSKSAKYLNIR